MGANNSSVRSLKFSTRTEPVGFDLQKLSQELPPRKLAEVIIPPKTIDTSALVC